MTLRDVAEAAGVSRSTASNVVAGTGRTSEKTRERVRRAMAELGYVYDQAAASLRRRHTRSVGVIVTNIQRPHFGELLIGMESTFTAAGYTALVLSTRDSLERQELAVATLREHNVAALAMIPATGSGDQLLSSLVDWGAPSVFVTRYVRDADHPYVRPDDVRGGRMAAGHLLEHGCRTLAYVGGYPDVNARIDRIAGAREAIEGTGVTMSEHVSEPSGEGGYALGLELASQAELPDGVLCHGDAVALGLLRALHDRGATGVRVIGFDGIAAGRFAIPSLTTVETDAFELGTRAATSVLEAIGTQALPGSFLQEPRLVLRESCGCHTAS